MKFAFVQIAGNKASAKYVRIVSTIQKNIAKANVSMEDLRKIKI